ATQEAIVLTGGDARFKTTLVDGQCKGALNFLTGTYAAIADNALAGVVGKVRVGVVGAVVQVVGTIKAIAHAAQAHHTGHVLQFAIAIGRTGQAVQGVIGDVQLHHIAAQLVQGVVFGLDNHAFFHQGGAGSRVAATAFNVHQTQTAGAKCFQRIGGAQLGNIDAGQG